MRTLIATLIALMLFATTPVVVADLSLKGHTRIADSNYEECPLGLFVLVSVFLDCRF